VAERHPVVIITQKLQEIFCQMPVMNSLSIEDLLVEKNLHPKGLSRKTTPTTPQ
jgi:hypothetical protein